MGAGRGPGVEPGSVRVHLSPLHCRRYSRYTYLDRYLGAGHLQLKIVNPVPKNSPVTKEGEGAEKVNPPDTREGPGTQNCIYLL